MVGETSCGSSHRNEADVLGPKAVTEGNSGTQAAWETGGAAGTWRNI